MHHRLLAPVLAGALLVAGACSDDGGGEATVGGVSSGDGDTEVRSGETIDANTGDVIATITSDVERGINRDGRVPLRIDVTRLQRNGDLVDLVFVLTNEHDVDDYVPYPNRWSDGSDRVIDGVQLVDQGNQRVYLAAMDNERGCLCSSSDFELAPGESIERYATYGGVPSDVTEVDIHLPFFPPIDGVPVSG